MKSGNIKRAVSALLCAVTLMAASGCYNEVPPNAISGGRIDNTDPNAPKVIKSKDITEFSASFFLSERWTAEERHEFDFQIKTDENGVLTAYENRSGLSMPADEELLKRLQAVIDEEKLAQRNGVYRVTSGLPPEYRERSFTAKYASGETLTFTLNNDPTAEWAEAVYTVFADWFSEKGDASLYPEKETSLITDLSLNIKRDGLYIGYGAILVGEDKAIDGETRLFERYVYDENARETLSRDFILFPEDYYEKLTERLVGYDLSTKYDFSDRDHRYGYYGMGGDADGDEEDSEDLHLELRIEYESGRRLNIETKKKSEIEAMSPITEAIIEYCDSLF